VSKELGISRVVLISLELVSLVSAVTDCIEPIQDLCSQVWISVFAYVSEQRLHYVTQQGKL
jgi:hypothetical protein